MAANDKRIVICGHVRQSGDLLTELILECAGEPLDFQPGRSAVTLSDDVGVCRLTNSASDITALKGLFSRPDGETFRILAVMQDPRDILTRRHATVAGEYAVGFDHALHVNAVGLPTYSGHGLNFINALIRNSKRWADKVEVVRIEDLKADPDAVQSRVAALTGLSMAKRFSEVFTKVTQRTCDEEEVGAWAGPQHAERVVRQFKLSEQLFDALEQWDYETDRAWFVNLQAQTAGALTETPGTIVGYYTDDARYREEAKRLTAAVERLKLRLDLTLIATGSEWLSVVRRKPHVLLEARRRLRGPLLYVDVDAIIHSDPWPYLSQYEGDMAIAAHHATSVFSGTILLNDTPGCLVLLEEWVREQQMAPEAWDQHSLQSVLANRLESGLPGPRFQYLPPAFSFVFDRRYNPPVTPVIEHLQASRELTSRLIGPDGEANLDRRRKRVAEINAELGLTAVEGNEDGGSQEPVMFKVLSPEERRNRTLRQMASGLSDIERWREPENLYRDWATRATCAALLISAPDRVLDLGCGQMDLERALDDGVTYIPADLTPRDTRTLPCDLNRLELPDVGADVVTMLGVMEYVHRPEEVLKAVARRWPRLLLSYNPADLDKGRDRRSHGWYNDLTSAALIDVARRAGFHLRAIVPCGQRERLYDLMRGDPS